MLIVPELIVLNGACASFIPDKSDQIAEFMCVCVKHTQPFSMRTLDENGVLARCNGLQFTNTNSILNRRGQK